MTTIDHDALARRIAEGLSTANYIVLRDASDAASFIANLLREALPTCEWTQQDTIFGTDWLSDCGKEFRIEEGHPKENGMKFCCFCGGKLVDVPFDEPEES